MRPLLLVLGLLASAPLPAVDAIHGAPCDADDVHAYPMHASNAHQRRIIAPVPLVDSDAGGSFAMQEVRVGDSNLAEDCDPADGAPGDFDGDYDLGDHGAFFAAGPWADETICDYRLARWRLDPTVEDDAYAAVPFVVGADDTSGPTILPDSESDTATFLTDGTILPGDPAVDPSADPDDCLTPVYFGHGTTCGTGGDGGYWVILLESYAVVREGSLASSCGPCHAAGTIT